MKREQKSRDYYAMLPNSILLEEVSCGVQVNWPELAVVLAQRLQEEQRRNDYVCSTCGEVG